MKHIIKEGSREHVIRYIQGKGAICSEKECEMNILKTKDVKQ